MLRVVEDFVPYDRSVLWQIQDAYFARRGLAAWDAGEVPNFATSNFAIARQHAALVIELARELGTAGALPLDQQGPLTILEVASGHGRFAASFFRALLQGTGPAGPSILPLIRYVLTDYSELGLRETIAQPSIARLIADGHVVPALLDVRQPDRIVTLDGEPVEGQVAVVVANYICCTLQPRIVQKTAAGLQQLHARVSLVAREEEEARTATEAREELMRRATEPGFLEAVKVDYDYRPAALEDALGSAFHARVVESALAPFEEGTAVYPLPFLEFLRAFAPRMVPGGLALVNDYGFPDRGELEGTHVPSPRNYGNTICFPVQFALFDAFCREAGFSLVRTRAQLRVLHTVAVRYSPSVPERFAHLFEATHVRRRDGERLGDLQTAARLLSERGDHAAAFRVFHRCLKYDPWSMDVLLGLGHTATLAGKPRLGLKYLTRGLEINESKGRDLLLASGDAFLRLGRPRKALGVLARALALHDGPDLQVRLAQAYELLSKREEALRAYRRVLEMAPDGPMADQLRRYLVNQFLLAPKAAKS